MGDADVRVVRLLRLCPGQLHNKRSALSDAGALCANRTSMVGYHVVDDGKAESEASMLAGRCAVGLSKPIEDEWQKLFTDALAGVGNTDLNRWSNDRHFHANTPAAVSKLHSIRQ